MVSWSPSSILVCLSLTRLLKFSGLFGVNFFFLFFLSVIVHMPSIPLVSFYRPGTFFSLLSPFPGWLLLLPSTSVFFSDFSHGVTYGLLRRWSNAHFGKVNTTNNISCRQWLTALTSRHPRFFPTLPSFDAHVCCMYLYACSHKLTHTHGTPSMMP